MKVQYPKSWFDVSINQYYNLCEAIAMDWETDTDKAIAMLSALSGVSIKSLNEDVPLTTLKKAITDISFIGDPKPKGVPRPYLRVGLRRFEVDLILRDSSASSFISLSDCTKDKETTNKNLHNVMAVFCHEVNWLGFRKKRTASSQKEIAEYLKNNMTMDKAFVYGGFFLKSWQGLSSATLAYLNKNNRKMMREMAKRLQDL